MATDFKESLKVRPDDKELQTGRELDAYREYILDNMPGYIMFMEAINQTITELEQRGVIGKTKMRTRVKATNSALINSNKKELDDIFGFEIVTQNEKDKEILMLIIHNLFEERYVQEKNHNKSNGYVAHHCIGAVKSKITGREIENLEEHILNAKTIQLKSPYRDWTNEQRQALHKSELFDRVYRYPVLRNEILDSGFLDDRLQNAFSGALLFMDEYLLPGSVVRKNMPVVETQFKTVAVEKETTCGRAQHVRYKKVNEEDIKRKYEQRQLVRGVDFPFVFVRNMKTKEMELESTNKTLISMWPFLQETIEKYKKEHKTSLASYDMYLAKVFPDLEPYVKNLSEKEPVLPIKNTNPDSIWNTLKRKIIHKDFILPEYKEVQEVGKGEQ